MYIFRDKYSFLVFIKEILLFSKWELIEKVIICEILGDI